MYCFVFCLPFLKDHQVKCRWKQASTINDHLNTTSWYSCEHLQHLKALIVSAFFYSVVKSYKNIQQRLNMQYKAHRGTLLYFILFYFRSQYQLKNQLTGTFWIQQIKELKGGLRFTACIIAILSASLVNCKGKLRAETQDLVLMTRWWDHFCTLMPVFRVLVILKLRRARIVCPVLKSPFGGSSARTKVAGCAASVALADEEEPSEAPQSQSPSDRRGSMAGCYWHDTWRAGL